MATDEIERNEAEASGNRGGRSQRKDDSREHEREQRGQQRPINRPPPGGKARAFQTRNHRNPLGTRSGQWCLALVDGGLILAGKQESAGVCTGFVFQLLADNFLLTVEARGSTK